MRCSILFLLTLVCVAASAQFKFYENGFDSYKKGDYQKAIASFSEYLTKSTRDKALDAEVFYLRGLSYYKTNDFQSALGDFEEAILRNHANTGNIHWFRAKCMDSIGQHGDAVNEYTSAIRELGTDASVKAKLLYERSLQYSKTGMLTQAYEDLANASDLDPANPDVKKELDKLNKQGVASRTVPETKEADKKSANNDKTSTSSTSGNSMVKEQKGATTPPVVTTVEKNSRPTDKKQKQNQKQQEEPEKQEVVIPPVPAKPTLADLYKDEMRYALVIGNSNYSKSLGVLKNPVNDATDMAKELRACNFDVDLLINATYGQMRAAMLKFKEKMDGGDRDKTVALFYFAGHGIQFEDENYLVPVDAIIEYQDDIARYCFPGERMVLANMERANSRMNIVILDACRNNALPSLTRSAGGGQGLGEMRRGRGSFIAYATAPGSVASDGSGKNGLYTQELLKAMDKPGLTLEQVFKEVRANVLRLSGGKQNTWDSSNIIGDFYFKFE